jgi:hypothetical protein
VVVGRSARLDAELDETNVGAMDGKFGCLVPRWIETVLRKNRCNNKKLKIKRDTRGKGWGEVTIFGPGKRRNCVKGYEITWALFFLLSAVF